MKTMQYTDIANESVCSSVCLSVTLRYCINMVELSWIAVSFWRSHFSYNIKPANGQNL